MIIPETCTSILHQIQNDLPNNMDFIPDFLVNQLIRYSSHPCYKEIVEKVASLAVQFLSIDDFHSFISRTINPEHIIQAVLDAADSYILEKNIQNAEILLHYIQFYEEGYPEKDNFEPFLSFRDFIEYAYYMTFTPPEQVLPVHPYLGTDILFVYSKLCAEKGDHDTAYAMLRKLINISPVNDAILFELTELYRRDGNLAEYRNATDQCFRYAWKADELAHAYRNMGYYFTESADYTGAITCYLMGATWEESTITAREIAYITEKTGNSPDISYYLSHGRDILADRGVPFGPNPEMIELMVNYANECIEEGDFFEARKYLSRAKALELSDNLEHQIEAIERFIEDITMF